LEQQALAAKSDEQAVAVRMIATVAGGRTRISVRFVPTLNEADASTMTPANSNDRTVSLLALASAFGKSMAHMGEGEQDL
jgi:hypothetical protein